MFSDRVFLGHHIKLGQNMGFSDLLTRKTRAASGKKPPRLQSAQSGGEKNPAIRAVGANPMASPTPAVTIRDDPKRVENSSLVSNENNHIQKHKIVRLEDRPATFKRRSLRGFLDDVGYAVAHLEIGSDRGLFDRLKQEVVDKPEMERKLVRDVAAFYGMDYREEIEGLTPDNRVIEELGFNNIKEKGCVPVSGGQVLTSDPFVDLCNGGRLVLTTAVNVHQLLRSSTASRVDDESDPHALLMDLLERAVLAEVSDVHIEPRQGGTIVRFRIDGILQEVHRFNKGHELHERLVNKIFELAKIEASMFTSLHDESFTIEILKKNIFIRVSSVPIPPHATGFKKDSHQSSIVLRLLYSRVQGVMKLEELGYDEDAVTGIGKLIKLPYGIVLMVGPTGSGKTTSLYSMMDMKRREPVKIVAIEDPVELPLDGIIQVEVNRERNTTFAKAIRSFLRHDPDVILVGEIRDEETAEEALRAALTGHLVLATLHANTAAEAIPRLLNLGLGMDQVLSALKGVIAQRLVRKLCPHCRGKVASPAAHLGMDSEELQFHYGHDCFKEGLWVPVGCKECDNTGYRGRTALWEILLLNSDVKRHIIEQNGFINTVEAMRACGRESMREVGMKFIQCGVTSLDEVERFVPVSRVTGALM
jgi:type II secretory ATPase GspE/PulE/Tfp pilus assembly ATPase PilB-like protein